MRPARLSVLTAAAVLLVLVPADPAIGGGGGGCYGEIVDARTNTVAIKDFCFKTQVARIRPGGRVTWVNRDRTRHNVIAVNYSWGRLQDKVMRRGTTVSRQFMEPGIYPYFCSLHTGMVGTVVVGNGKPPGGVPRIAPVDLKTAAVKTSGETAAQEAPEVLLGLTAVTEVTAELWA